MDALAFDRLTRMLGSTSSRRAALGALVAASPLAGLLDASTRKRKGRRKGDGRDQHKGEKGAPIAATISAAKLPIQD